MDIRKLIQDRGVEGALIAVGEYLNAQLEKEGKDITPGGEVVETKKPEPTPEPFPPPFVEPTKGVTLG